MQRKSEIKKVVTGVKLNDKKTDSAYWRKQSYSARLEPLEEIRQEYHGKGPRMQEVLAIGRMKDDNS